MCTLICGSQQAEEFCWAASGAAMIQRKLGFTNSITVCDPFSLSVFELRQIIGTVFGRRLDRLLINRFQIRVRCLIVLNQACGYLCSVAVARTVTILAQCRDDE